MDQDQKRLKLHEELLALHPSYKVYFEAPENLSMEYPCLLYEFTGTNILYANNQPYLTYAEYEVKSISEDADNPMLDILLNLSGCVFDRRFVADRLYHDVFTITR